MYAFYNFQQHTQITSIIIKGFFLKEGNKRKEKRRKKEGEEKKEGRQRRKGKGKKGRREERNGKGKTDMDSELDRPGSNPDCIS